MKYRIPAAGNSMTQVKYSYIDKSPVRAINYYRLVQVDYDGTKTYYSILDSDNTCVSDVKPVRITNILGQEVDEYYDGCRFIHYSDGSILKIYGN